MVIMKYTDVYVFVFLTLSSVNYEQYNVSWNTYFNNVLSKITNNRACSNNRPL